MPGLPDVCGLITTKDNRPKVTVKLSPGMLEALKVLANYALAFDAANPYLQPHSCRQTITVQALVRRGLVKIFPGAPGKINCVQITDDGMDIIDGIAGKMEGSDGQ